jgi:hypothetical protein
MAATDQREGDSMMDHELKQRLDSIDGQLAQILREVQSLKGERQAEPTEESDLMQQYHETMDQYLKQEKEQGQGIAESGRRTLPTGNTEG